MSSTAGMTSTTLELYAELADLTIGISRELKVATARAASPADQPIELSVNEGVVMRYIDKNPGRSPSAVATATGLQRSNLSTILRALEERKMVRKVVDEDDCRAARLYATDVAADNLARLQRVWRSRLERAVGAQELDLAGAVQVLRRIEAGLVEVRLAR